jgi:competence protein ComEC
VALTFGIGLRSVWTIPLPTTVWMLLLSLSFAFLWHWKPRSFLLCISICFLFVSVGVLRTDYAAQSFGVSTLESLVDTPVVLTGVVIREPDIREKSVHLYVQTEIERVLVIADRHTEVTYGDQVMVSGTLKKPTVFTTELGRTFNYPGYLKAKGVEYSISFGSVIILDVGKGNPIISLLLTGKQLFLTSIKHVIPEPAVGLGSGLLLGVKAALGEDIESDFRKTGIIHIVVLSGYNVMLVATFILFIFSFLLSPRVRLVAGIVAIIAFALVVGLSATVVRASIMAVLVLVAQSFGRQYDVLRALFFAGAIMLMINPYLLMYDIGFQLSFMATLGLLLIVPHFESKGIEGKNIFGMRDFFFATVSTQIAVLPLLLYHIGEVSLISVVVNMFVLPVVPVAMLLTFITGIIGLFSITVASVIGFMALISLNYILFIAKWFAALPFAAVTVPQFSFIGVVLLYAAFAGIYIYIKSDKKEETLLGWEIVDEEKEAGPSLN